MAGERKKKALEPREEALAGLDLGELLGERRPRKKGQAFEEPEAFGTLEGPASIGGEEFKIEFPEKYAEEEKPRIRERIISPWEEPLAFEREEKRGKEWHAGLLAESLPWLSLRQNKGVALAAFAVIYLVFGGALTYLFFFNSGLAFDKENQNGQGVLLLKNASQHLINDVVLSLDTGTGEGKTLLEIPAFEPGATRKIELAQLPQQKNVTLVANARYHQTVTARLSLETLSQETRLRSSFQVPKVAFVGQKFEVKIEVCNEAAQPEAIQVREAHDAKAFAEQATRTYKIELGGEQCATVVAPFTPARAGKTSILFNLVSRDNTDKHEVPLEVRA